MKTKNEINEKINELARTAIGTEGSKAYKFRGQVEILKWVLEE